MYYITPTENGNTVTIAGLAETEAITVTVTVAEGVTASFTVDVVEHEKSEQSELHIDFTDTGVDFTGWSGEWILTSVGDGGVSSGRFSTGGSSGSSRYIELELADYQSATITVAVTMASSAGTATTARYLYLETQNSSTQGSNSLAYAASTYSGDKVTLYYTGAISAEKLYLTYNGGTIYIYSIDIVITEANTETEGVTYTVEYDSNAITVSASEGNVEGTLTYEVNVSGIITVDAGGTVTPAEDANGTVTVTVKLDGKVIGAVEITVGENN